jgi:putative DNA primase/helicase
MVMHNAILETQNNLGAPVSLIAASLLGSLSLACQDKILVRRMDGLEGPCSLFLLTIAESGERKTACDKIFLKPIKDFEDKCADKYTELLGCYTSAKEAWEAERNGMLLEIKNRSKCSEPVGDLKKMLTAIDSQEPIKPKSPKLILSNATPEAILQRYHQRWLSAGIMADEGAVIFDSRTMRDLGMLNKLWDGDTLYVDRASSESFAIKNARLTISLMTQPQTLQQFFKKQGELSRDNGFLARFLFSYPTSTQGTRFIRNTDQTWKYQQPFQDRISEILNSDISETGQNLPTPEIFGFSPEAQTRWIRFHNNVEFELQSGRFLSDIRDSAAKIADNMARLAALFHYFQGYEGDIGIDSVERASAICEWYLVEFKRLFGARPEIPVEIQDSNTLENWLIHFCNRNPGTIEVSKNLIAQLGPNALRKSKIRREAALYVLAKIDKIRILARGKTKLVALNPIFFPTEGYYPSPQISQPMQYLPHG